MSCSRDRGWWEATPNFAHTHFFQSSQHEGEFWTGVWLQLFECKVKIRVATEETKSQTPKQILATIFAKMSTFTAKAKWFWAVLWNCNQILCTFSLRDTPCWFTDKLQLWLHHLVAAGKKWGRGEVLPWLWLHTTEASDIWAGVLCRCPGQKVHFACGTPQFKELW